MSVRLVRSEMNSMPSGLMAPHVLIAMMTSVAPWGSLEGMGRRRSHVKGPLAALPSRRRARPVGVVAGSFRRARKARDATTAEAAL